MLHCGHRFGRARDQLRSAVNDAVHVEREGAPPDRNERRLAIVPVRRGRRHQSE